MLAFIIRVLNKTSTHVSPQHAGA